VEAYDMTEPKFEIETKSFNSEYMEVLYHEQDKILFLSKDAFSDSKIFLRAVFGRFNPPHDDESLSAPHWQTISERLARYFGCQVSLSRTGAKFREDVWRVFLDGSVKGVLRWHDNGKEMDLRRIEIALPYYEVATQIILDPEPKWLSGVALTEKELARMKSYVSEMLTLRNISVEFVANPV
jgi:hypothetical protein